MNPPNPRARVVTRHGYVNVVVLVTSLPKQVPNESDCEPSRHLPALRCNFRSRFLDSIRFRCCEHRIDDAIQMVVHGLASRFRISSLQCLEDSHVVIVAWLHTGIASTIEHLAAQRRLVTHVP